MTIGEPGLSGDWLLRLLFPEAVRFRDKWEIARKWLYSLDVRRGWLPERLTGA